MTCFLPHASSPLMKTILVLGANGSVGSELSQSLEQVGHTVRRATSRTADAGAVHVNLLSGDGLANAMQGVDAAFLLSPTGHVNVDELLGPVVEQAREHGVQKLVLMTAIGVDTGLSAPMRTVEREVEASGIAWNVIRPNSFMQNLNSYWLHGIAHADAIMLPAGTSKGSFIDARDIASVAAALLQHNTFDNRAFDLTGGEALDYDAVAQLLSAESGRAIRYQEISRDDMRAGLLGAGLPEPYAEFILLTLDYFERGDAERVTDAVPLITGRSARTMTAYLKDYRAAFVRS